jgi:hypothetical protein
MVKAAVVGGTQFDYWATFEHFTRVLEMLRGPAAPRR